MPIESNTQKIYEQFFLPDNPRYRHITVDNESSNAIGLTFRASDIPKGKELALRISYNTKVIALPDDLHQNVKEVNVFCCDNFQDIGNIQSSAIEVLTIEGCDKLDLNISKLPKQLKKLGIRSCELLSDLNGEFPETLEYLTIRLKHNAPNSNPVLGTLPKNLKSLIIDGKDFNQPVRNLPYTLNKIVIHSRSFNQDLSPLPRNLRKLDLRGCAGLTKLPNELPTKIRYINLSGCTSLTDLPDKLPPDIRYINLSGCSGLPDTQEMRDKIASWEETYGAINPDFRVIWPEHLEIADKKTTTRQKSIKEKIENAYEAHHASTRLLKGEEPSAIADESRPFLNLIHLYTAATRIGLRHALTALEPIAEALEKNPHLLKLVDLIATQYTGPYIGQLPIGMMKIANIIESASQDNTKDKLERMKAVIAIDIIHETMLKLGVGRENEIECVRAMLHEVKTNLGIGAEEWLGVTRGRSYGPVVREFLTPRNINMITAMLENEVFRGRLFGETDTGLIENICNGKYGEYGEYGKFWAESVLSKEDIDKLYEPLLQAQNKRDKLDAKKNKKQYNKACKDYAKAEEQCREAVKQHAMIQTFNDLGIALPEHLKKVQDALHAKESNTNETTTMVAESEITKFKTASAVDRSKGCTLQ